MNTKHTDVVAEYLHEVDLRLAGLPVLQRRELLADLAAHIAGERAERNIQSEGELIEVLERLGSPEVVAAAAHEEAGTVPGGPPRPRSRRIPWYVPVIAVVLLLVVLFLCFAMTFSRSSTSVDQAPAPAPTATAPSTR
jgi:hypothetical protein